MVDRKGTRLFKRAATSLAICIACAGASLAQEWEAIVIGQPGQGAARAFSDAYHAAEALRINGFETVHLLRDAPREDLERAFSETGGAERVVIYFAGPLTNGGTTLRVKDDVLELSALVEWFQLANISQAAILVENCSDPNTNESLLSFPPIPEDLEVYLAASAGPGEDCRTIETRLTDQLKDKTANPGGSLQESLTGLPNFSTLLDAIPFTPPAIAAAPAAQNPVVSIVGSDVVALTPVAAPVQGVTSIAPVTSAQPSLTSGRGGVVIFEPPAQSQLAAIPVAVGLPEPSIIVGIIEAQEASFDAVATPGDVGSTEITYENLTERRRLRAEQPELFETLVSSGAFDPPENLLVVALQTELERMRCYTAGVDGQWGGGSKRSVTRYFDEISGVQAVSLEPDFPLFRQIIRRDDIVCPAPVARAPAASTPRASTTRTQTRQSTTSRPRAAAAPKPKPKPAPARKPSATIRLGTGSGVFR